ncbi:MAG: hypothetical protein ABSG94_12270 [Brevinematales bacterium]|jgi:hypothetical protein
MNDDKSKIPDILKQLCESLSKNNKAATGFWIAIAVISTIVLMPTNNEIIELTYLKIKVNDLYPFSFFLISFLIICFGSITAQGMRTRKLIYKYIDGIIKEDQMYCNIYIQDICDSIISSNINRVAPLAQHLNKDSFYPETNNITLLSCLSGIYFICLRLIGIAVIELFPAYSLLYSLQKYLNSSCSTSLSIIPIFIYWIIGIMSLVILFQLCLLDIIYGIKSFGYITGINKKGK